MGVLSREISALYIAYAAGRPSPLKELLIQYADFAVWQRDWLEHPELKCFRDAAGIEAWLLDLARAQGYNDVIKKTLI